MLLALPCKRAALGPGAEAEGIGVEGVPVVLLPPRCPSLATSSGSLIEVAADPAFSVGDREAGAIPGRS